ncbi:hypothetical protein [Janthinobacterium fluminis]|uniref:Uncharacterized protein n=1 Tax=Janthinobacterium fluminis TaxID=2987524 RepID=A0ABT5K6K4_9BURK|nr:hypothetical protein [Janthinobacterium fluminis]MDC8759701.1 hypothetical protein [Janthinobacterium fluminis]
MASLTVYGDDRTLQTIREALPTEPVSDWKKGDTRSNGRHYLDSGFSVDIAAVDSPALLLDSIRSYLSECSERGISFDEPRIVAELQIGLSAADPAQAPASLDLPLEDLTMLAEMGVCLSLTALRGA